MKLLDYLRLAIKNIWRQKLRSALTIFAVVIGATSVTIMLALVTGARNFFSSQFSANGALQQIAISANTDLANFDEAGHGGNNCDSCVKLTEAIVSKVKTVPHVTAVARKLTSGSFEAIVYNGTKLRLGQIQSYDANGVLSNTMLAGRDITDTDPSGLITISSDYADKWGFKGKYQDLIGKQLQLVSRSFYTGVGATIALPSNEPDNRQSQTQPPTTLTATVVGVADASNQSEVVRAAMSWVRQMNTNQQYQFTEADRLAQEVACRKSSAACNQQHFTLVSQDFFDTNGYDSLTAKVDDTKNAAAAVVEIKKFGIGAADAESFIKSQLQIFNIVGLVLGGIGAIALLVAAIGVINTMVMAILERTREIGVMRACGATKKSVRRLFTFEAATLGFLGGVLGVAGGYGLTYVANIFINQQLNSNSLTVHNIITLPLWLIAAVIGITTLIGMLAGLYPAARAAKLDPVDALRYE